MFDSLVNTPFKLSSTEILLSAASTICLLNLSKAGRKERILSEICEPPQYGFTASASYEKCGPKFLRITDIKEGYVDWNSVPFCKCDYPHKYELNTGDVLVARSGSVGKSFIVSEVPERAIFASYMIRLRYRAGLLPSYLYWCFQSQQFWHQIMNVRRGSAMKNINGRMLSSLRFPIPSKTEQYLQSQFLSAFQEKLQGKNISLPKLPDSFGNTKRIVEKIQELTSKIEEAKGLRRGAIESAEAVVDSALSQIFNREKPYGLISNIRVSDLEINKECRNPAIVNPNEDFLYLDISNVESKTGRILEVKKIKGYSAPSRARRVIRTNNVLFSTVRPYLRSFTIVPSFLDNQICSTGFAVFSCPKGINPKFLFYHFLSPFFIEQCEAKMRGGHYPAINDTNLKKLKLIIPDIPEQNRIVAYLDNLQAKIDNLKRLQHETQSELDALTPSILAKAFKGKL